MRGHRRGTAGFVSRQWQSSNLVWSKGLAKLRADGTVEIESPSHFWQCDEKGVNDDDLAGAMLVTTAGGGTRRISRRNRSIRHISVWNLVCAIFCVETGRAKAPYPEKSSHWMDHSPEVHV